MGDTVIARAFVTDSENSIDGAAWNKECSFEYDANFARFKSNGEVQQCHKTCDFGAYSEKDEKWLCILGFVLVVILLVDHAKSLRLRQHVWYDRSVTEGGLFMLFLLLCSSTLTISILWVSSGDVCYLDRNKLLIWSLISFLDVLFVVLSKVYRAGVPSGYPSTGQVISDSIRVYSKEASILGSENDEECSICMEKLSVTEIKGGNARELIACGHVFHEACLKKWVRGKTGRGANHRTCPLCRVNVDEISIELT